MKNCLVYFRDKDKFIKLTGVRDLESELPLYLSSTDADSDLSSKDKITDEDLTNLGIHIVLFDKNDNYVIIFKDKISESYSGTFPKYRQVVENAYVKRFGKDNSKDLFKLETGELLKGLSNVEIISV